MKIYTTIGVYPNGDYKVNGVKEENLYNHIKYNKEYRPGRGLIIDGEIFFTGSVERGVLNSVKEKTKEIKLDKDTAPYE